MKQFRLIHGDITGIRIDAIVNAANSTLLGGHGVDGAIHQAGGADIIEECRQIRARQGSCTVGEAVMTTGGRLPAQYVIHTVGPIWEEGKANERTLLSQAYQNSFALAEQHYLTGIAYPNISTGVYHFPKAEAAAIAIDTLIPLLKNSETVQEVALVCFDLENFELYEELLKQRLLEQQELKLKIEA